jgi:hypothetical protein
VTSELYIAECGKGISLELSTGSHRYESVVQFRIGQLLLEKVLCCVKIMYVCTHVGEYLCMYIIQPRFHMCQSSLLWAGGIVGYELWRAEKKMNNLHAVDLY